MASQPPTISPSERIRELSAINADVPHLLTSAGNAIQALTGQTRRDKVDGGNGDTDGDLDMSPDTPTLDSQKGVFTTNATAYFTHLQSIMARLRRQAYALEEAGIIAVEAPTLSTTSSIEHAQRPGMSQGAGIRRGQASAAAPKAAAEEERNGGLGNLDVGYLNSRGNRIGMEKEAELVAEARRMLEEAVAKKRDENVMASQNDDEMQ